MGEGETEGCRPGDLDVKAVDAVAGTESASLGRSERESIFVLGFGGSQGRRGRRPEIDWVE